MKAVCPHLVNNRPCPFGDGGCPCSHTKSTIKWWKKNAGKTPCGNGPSCEYLLIQKCLWFHPKEHLAQGMELQQTERVVEVTGDLVVLQIVTAESLKVGDSFTGITDFWELASFNKVADDEIAVPGMSSFLRTMLISSVADTQRLAQAVLPGLVLR
jgi:hypothetical protein